MCPRAGVEAKDPVIGQVQLDAHLAAHQAWLDLQGGEQLVLDGADLRGLSLAGARLALGELSECDLTDVDLARADLHRSRLLGCRLDGASLRRADLRKAELIEVSAARTSFELAYAPDVELRRGDFREASFRRAYLLEATFDGVDLRGTEFEDVDCDQASFAGSVFEEDQLRSVFRGAVGSLLKEDVVLSAAAGRRRVTTDELVDRAGGLPVRFTPVEAVSAQAVQAWRWSEK